MLMNSLDPEVAERPEDLVVYGGRGKAARDWDAYEAIVTALRALENDETLLIQSGKPVAVFQTHAGAPRVLLANSNLVPHWATQDHFEELAAKGLMMYGQMTAGSWIYIGTQGILQGTYETLGALASQQGWDSLKGKFVLPAGLGRMGGAQPLSITMNEGVGLIVEVDLIEPADGIIEVGGVRYTPTWVDRRDYTILPVALALADPELADVHDELRRSWARTVEVIESQIASAGLTVSLEPPPADG